MAERTFAADLATLNHHLGDEALTATPRAASTDQGTVFEAEDGAVLFVRHGAAWRLRRGGSGDELECWRDGRRIAATELTPDWRDAV